MPIITPLIFPTLHEVIGYGRIRRADIGRAIWVEVLLQDIDENPVLIRDVWTENATANLKSVWITCGLMDLVPIGSQWINGEWVGNRPGEFRFVKIPEERGVVRLGAGRSPDLKRLGDMPCYQLLCEERDGEPRWIYLPVAELIRSLFGVSSHFLIRMFGGYGARQLARRSAFYDRDRLNRIDADTVRLYCAARPTDIEAVVAAASLYHAGMTNAHEYFTRHIHAGLASPGQPEIPFDMPFPFNRTSLSLDFEGRYVDVILKPDIIIDKEPPLPRRFLVTKILHARYPMPFKKVEIMRDARARPQDAPPGNNRQAVNRGHVVNVQQHMPPNGLRQPVNIREPGAGIMPDDEIEVIHLPLEQGADGPPTLIIDSSTTVPTEASVDDPEPGSSRDVAHAQLNRQKRALEKPDPLRLLSPAVESIDETQDAVFQAAGQNNWKVPFHSVTTVLLPGGKGFKFLLMELECPRTADHPEGRILVAEADAPRGAKALGLLRLGSRQPFTDKDRDHVTEFAKAERGCWRDREQKLPGFKIAAVSRTPIENDQVKDYAGLLTRAVSRLLNR